MPNHQELEEAIIALEAQRAVLGPEVVDISLAALRQKLRALQSSPVTEQYGSIVVLVADLSGFTVMSESMDAEELRDTINAIWERLDAVVEAWGGEIDKHVGDGLIALFGVSGAQPDDCERAILAALDMQMELALINRQSMDAATGRLPSASELKMRIGIDSGPIYFGQVGMSDAYTAVGDAVSQATQLQQMAPVGGVLISGYVSSQVHAHFKLEPHESAAGAAHERSQTAYLVKEEKPQSFQPQSSGIVPGTGRIVGRQAELEKLQQLLQACIDDGRASFLTVIGQAGIGKSRLLAEFEQSFKLLPTKVAQFRGRVRRVRGQSPYALFREMFMHYFGIHPRSRPHVAREKLAQRLMHQMPGNQPQIPAYCICQLLGFDIGDALHLKQQVDEICRIRERAYGHVAQFFRAACQEHSAVTLILEDMESADEKSLDLLDYIYESCQDQPLLIVSTGRPSIQKIRPSWRTLGATSKLGHRKVSLGPLSTIDSRHLISQSLPGPARPTLNLTELMLEQTHGNPAQIADYSQLLIESDLISDDTGKWQVQWEKSTDGLKLPTLKMLLQSRLQKLGKLQRNILRRASVLGETFWKSAILPTADFSPEEQETALNALEEQRLIRINSESEFRDIPEYRFGYYGLRSLVYETLSGTEQRQYHAEAAAWLIVHGDPQIADYAGLIAGHLEKAGETERAAEWFSRAGAHARAAFAHDTAIQQYRRALRLLPDVPQLASRRVKLNGVLGELLHRQTRFTEAIAVYKEMRSEARLCGDYRSETAAVLGTFMAQINLGNHTAALVTSQQAEERAREINSPSHLSMALVAKSWALIHLDDLETSLDMAQEALEISTRAGSRRAIAYSNALIGGISRIQQWYEQAAQKTAKALEMFRELGDVLWEAIMLGNLGHIAFAQHDYDTAKEYYQSSLLTARDIGDHYGIIRCLRKLGEIAQANGTIQQTVKYYQRAFVQAEKSRNLAYCAQIALDLGWLNLGLLTNALQQLGEVERDSLAQQAQTWLERALFFARKMDVAPLVTVAAKAGLAQLLLEFMQPEQALNQARAALGLAKKTLAAKPGRQAQKWVAICWRVMGLVASELPPQELPILIDNRAYDATASFYRSLHVFSQMGRGVEAEFARSLLTWANYELNEGDHVQGQFLWSRAKDIFNQIGMEHEVGLMEQIRPS